MEQNTNIPPVPPNMDTKPRPLDSLYQHHPKKTKAIIILAVVLLVILVVLYFLNKQKQTEIVPYTQEQVIDLMDNVSQKTEEQGVPDKQKQLEIIKYNTQD
jgi:regulatory protein YycI of two-component signal transduction system YycFG